MKVERLGACISVLMVCLLTFVPVNTTESTKDADLYTQPKEIAYQIDNIVNAADIKNTLDSGVKLLKEKVKNNTVIEEVKTTKEQTPTVVKEQKKEVKQVEVKKEVSTESVQKKEEQKKEVVEKVFDNMTMDELTAKLNKSLNSTLSNKGDTFAKYSIQYGVDPYLATAIALHETGCAWNCSTLVKQCNNVGGQKGSPGCGGGSYKSFPTLDAGIEGFISNLYYNYYKQGLNTPEKMNSKYAASTTWATQVNNYIKSIKSK